MVTTRLPRVLLDGRAADALQLQARKASMTGSRMPLDAGGTTTRVDRSPRLPTYPDCISSRVEERPTESKPAEAYWFFNCIVI